MECLTARQFTWLEARGAQGVCDMRAAHRQLPQAHAVQYVRCRLARPHDGWAAGVRSCSQPALFQLGAGANS